MDFENIERKDRFETMKEQLRGGLITEKQVRFMAALKDPDAMKIFPDNPGTNFTNREYKQDIIKEINEKQLVLFNLAVANEVLPYVVEIFPKDKRLPRAIDYAYMSFNKAFDYGKSFSSAIAFASEYGRNAPKSGYDNDTIVIGAHATKTILYALHSLAFTFPFIYTRANAYFGYSKPSECFSQCIDHAKLCSPKICNILFQKILLDIVLKSQNKEKLSESEKS